MCGIWGCIGKSNGRFLEVLAYRMQTRGRDATGFYNGFKIYKDSKEAIEFIPKHIKQLYNNKRFVIGHTRQASSGSAHSKQNAHPFKTDPIIGVHNGCLNNIETLSTTFNIKKTVDSEYLIYAIAHDQLPIVSGWMAVVWYDRRTNTINFFRHSASLWMGNRGNTLYYASTKESLKDFCDNVKEIPTDLILTYHLHTKTFTSQPIELIGTADPYTTYLTKYKKDNLKGMKKTIIYRKGKRIEAFYRKNDISTDNKYMALRAKYRAECAGSCQPPIKSCYFCMHYKTCEMSTLADFMSDYEVEDCPIDNTVCEA